MANDVTDLMPRYLSRFTCIGSACEATCCAGWRVLVDEKHYKQLKAAVDRDNDKRERERFSRSHKRMRGKTGGPLHYAFIVLDDNDACPMLDADKLCSTQKKYGAEMLSNTCAFYPRTIQQFGERQEMTATLSCPEIARQVLLHDDALELMPAAHELGGRPMLGLRPNAVPDPHYSACLNEVREMIIELLTRRQFPMATRLFFVSYLGERTKASFNQQSADPALLANEFARIIHPEMLRSCSHHFDNIDVPNAIAAAIVVDVFRDRLAELPNGSFRQLIADVITGREGFPLDTPGAIEVDVSPGALWQTHRARLAGWSDTIRTRIDQYFENYARNYWLRDWYVGSQDLFIHTRRLLVRVAIVRFLLISHPRLASGDFDQATLDATAVEVFYKFSRGLEHSPTFLLRIDEILDERGMNGLEHLVFLLKF